MIHRKEISNIRVCKSRKQGTKRTRQTLKTGIKDEKRQMESGSGEA